LFYYLCVYLTTGFILGRVTKSHAEFYSKLEKKELKDDEKSKQNFPSPGVRGKVSLN